jgi:hypothetical protein
MTLTQQIKNIDLVVLMKAEGINLQRWGNKYIGLCPFHDDHNPSMNVFTDNHYKCYACGEYGDAVDFIKRSHSFSTKEALQHLGVNQGPVTADMLQRIAETDRKRKEKEQHRQHESDLIFTLSKLIHHAYSVMAGIKTIEDMENIAEVIDRLPWWEYCHDTLIYGTDDEKQKCLEDLKDMPLKKRDRIFNPDFDFSGWLRKFIANGTDRRANQ